MTKVGKFVARTFMAALLCAMTFAPICAFALPSKGQQETLYPQPVSPGNEIRYLPGMIGAVVGLAFATGFILLWGWRSNRRPSEKELMESALLELPVGVMIADCPDGRISFANKTASALMGVPIETLHSIDMSNVPTMSFSTYEMDGSPCPVERVPIFEAMLQDKPIPRRELIIRHQNGTESIIFVGAAPIRDASGRAFAIMATFHDISEERRSASLLKKRSEELATLFENMSQGVLLVGPDLRISAFNRRFLEMFDLPDGFLSGRPPMDKIVDYWAEAANAQQKDIDRVRREVLSRESFTHEIAFKGRTLEMRHSPLSDGSFVRTLSDLSDRKREEEERLKRERESLHSQKLESLGILAGGIAHDFNNLLLAILGNLELAKVFAMQDRDELAKRLSDAENAAMRAADLTRQLLAYSGKGKFQVKSFDLSDLVSEMASLLKVSISKGAALNIDLASNLPKLKGDPTQVQQVIMNLIVNASEALGDKAGEITVSTGVKYYDERSLAGSRLEQHPPPGLFIFLEVRDSGSGMDPETLRRLFEPFFTTKPSGRGLGMSAALGIMRSHRGAIIVDSEKGKGSVFKMLFPAEVATPSAIQEAQQTTPPDVTPLSGCVLIVDDETMVRTLCCALVSKLGLSSIAASDGPSALEMFKARHEEITCVLLDVSMPGMDGLAVMQGLREINPSVKVALSSGHSFEEVAGRFEGCPVAGYIQKPFHLNDLRRELRRIILS